MIEQVADACVQTHVRQVPVLAADCLVTQRTHLEAFPTVTRLLATTNTSKHLPSVVSVTKTRLF